MAVPPAPVAGPASLDRARRLPFALDLVVGLLTILALPLAAVTVPNTISVVGALLPPHVAGVGMLRAHGLALPAMLCAVPFAAAALRRVRPAPILVAGLALLAAADVAGGFADSALAVAALRVAHGVGAGMLLPATLAAGWERSGPARRVLVTVWAGALSVSLLAAQALALWPLDEATSWRVTLQPYPLVTGVALALAAVHLLLSRTAEASPAIPGAASGAASAGSQAGPDGPFHTDGRPARRGELALTAGPSAGIALLALGTTLDWPPGLIVVAAAVAVAVLLATASAAGAGPGDRLLAFTMVAVGLAVLPTAAQVTYVELRGLGGPGLSGMWAPFALAAVTAFAAAWGAGRVSQALAPKTVYVGLVTLVAGLCAVRLFLPAATGAPLLAPFVLLAAGAAIAVTSALRSTGPGAALFGLCLCFPAVLSGFLLGTGIQVGALRAASSSGLVTSQAMVDGFVSALHVTALLAGAVVVLVLLFGAALRRRAPGRRRETPATASHAPDPGQASGVRPEVPALSTDDPAGPLPGTSAPATRPMPAAPSTAPMPALPAASGSGRSKPPGPAGPGPVPGPREAGDEDTAKRRDGARAPAVPAPTPSPESTDREDGGGAAAR
ncbi:hypothetical protein [Sphaerisporangium sp. TRM90804]|uniref:hypothetical protein n=1 Tax=Sphaerisporangium sp. TRM90804 TaxID=3031113 RepID=UPI00244B89BB|nr:hypothetical protein [Sphaerisporangium sp. TRM90804]MDH2428118.1 hypothetical protein [Sphaerisporangium sp. TRM90804]